MAPAGLATCVHGPYVDYLSQIHQFAEAGLHTVSLQAWIEDVQQPTVERFVTVGAGGWCCVYSISPVSSGFEAAGGSGSVWISSNEPSCPWYASTLESWIEITSDPSGFGDGVMDYLVEANTECRYRTGTINVAERRFTVTQGIPPGCEYVFIDGFETGDTSGWSDSSP